MRLKLAVINFDVVNFRIETKVNKTQNYYVVIIADTLHIFARFAY